MLVLLRNLSKPLHDLVVPSVIIKLRNLFVRTSEKSLHGIPWMSKLTTSVLDSGDKLSILVFRTSRCSNNPQWMSGLKSEMLVLLASSHLSSGCKINGLRSRIAVSEIINLSILIPIVQSKSATSNAVASTLHRPSGDHIRVAPTTPLCFKYLCMFRISR